VRFDVITLFPELVHQVTQWGITERALRQDLFDLKTWNPRDYTADVHQTVDGRPYGGGPGMVMLYQPLADALQDAQCDDSRPAKVVYLSPQGRRLDQASVNRFVNEQRIILIAGRYEGIDERFIDEYVKYPASLRKIARNATPYLYHIVEEVEKRGMPLEIALLPAIESLYQPIARSHKSAVGIWQFMSATGGEYGLVQNSWYDGRRDIIKSTTAALDYLQKLHQSFDDDWLLALAAYNTGPGNVRKAIKRNRRQGKSTDFWSLKLPRETREYVPKLLGLSDIIANYQFYGLELQAIANQPYFERVNVGRQIDLYLAARLAGLSLSAFKHLNPGYKRKETSPTGPHYIVLPVEKVQLFKQRLDRVLAQMMLSQATYE
jgi:soluble lytic murein transglycosylase-like protein